LEICKSDASINRKLIIIFTIIGGLLLVLALIVLIVRSNRERKKINLGLERKNTQIESQKNQIEEKNKMITDSIDYARTIQDAILPPEEKVKAVFPESFIVFIPMNIVSGDFYWMNQIHETVLFATVDCAGEGVPGAFMSIMTYNMLESIVIEKKLSDPSLILNELNNIMAAKNHKSSVKYAADISLIAINKKKNELQFAGTKMPLVIIRDSKMNEFATEIGKSQTIPLQKSDMIYLFTDGALQYTGFMEAMPSLAVKSIEEQKQIHQNKTKITKQTDDYLVVGIRV